MKIGPGVDTSLRTHHAGEGLMFQPQHDGTVRVMKTNGEWPLATGQNLLLDVTIPAAAWASVVAFTSKDGETAEKFADAEELLGYGQSVALR